MRYSPPYSSRYFYYFCLFRTWMYFFVEYQVLHKILQLWALMIECDGIECGCFKRCGMQSGFDCIEATTLEIDFWNVDIEKKTLLIQKFNQKTCQIFLLVYAWFIVTPNHSFFSLSMRWLEIPFEISNGRFHYVCYLQHWLKFIVWAIFSYHLLKCLQIYLKKMKKKNA